MTTARPLTIGVDPGGRYTGIALLAPDRDAAGLRRLLAAEVLTRPAGPLLGGAGLKAWCAEVLEHVAAMVTHAAGYAPPTIVEEQVDELLAFHLEEDWHPFGERTTVTRPATPAELVTYGAIVVAVEDVQAPNPHARRRDGSSLTNPEGIIATAAVLGAIFAAYPCAVVVDVGQNGSGPIDAYPPAIRKGARLGGPSDHARSAYDVAFRARAAAAMRPDLRPSPARATRRH